MNYEDACKQATTDQGLDPVVKALADAGLAVSVEQTGGMCMVAYVPQDTRFEYPRIGVTAGETEDHYLVCQYGSWDDGVELAYDAPLAHVVLLAQEFAGLV